MKIVYMGTPEFAVPPLQSLFDHGYSIDAVVTQPDRHKGRGRKLVSPPVKEKACDLGINILQPETIRSVEFSAEIGRMAPDLLVVVAFGQVLPKPLIDLSKYGAVNVHASLLPKYRGPAPIQWAIIKGERQTGITTMQMDEGLDTGDILLTETTDISDSDTADTLHDRLSDLGGEVLLRTVKEMEAGMIRPIPQDHAQATYAPMLRKKDGAIDWSRPAAEIERFIRGMNPWPCAYTFYGNRRIRIFRGEIAAMDSSEPPGTVIRGFADELRVATGKEALSILELQGESGKRLPVNQYLRGSDIACGAKLGEHGP